MNGLQKKVGDIEASLKNARNILAIAHNELDASKRITIQLNGRRRQAPRRHRYEEVIEKCTANMKDAKTQVKDADNRKREAEEELNKTVNTFDKLL